MCASVIKEVIAHFNASGSNMYACLLYTSRAFDQLDHDKLFNKVAEALVRIVLCFGAETVSNYGRNKKVLEKKNYIFFFVFRQILV